MSETFADFMKSKYMLSGIKNINIIWFVCLFLIISVSQKLGNKKKKRKILQCQTDETQWARKRKTDRIVHGVDTLSPFSLRISRGAFVET